MNYELIEQINKAEFPFSEHDKREPCLRCRSVWTNGFMQPTLSELIEACGDYFALWKSSFDGQWHSSFSRYGTGYDDTFIDNDYDCLKASGPTPEEAVARLWLALHAKK